MATSTYNRIETLTKSNYDTWCLQAQAVLIKAELWDYVSGATILASTATAEQQAQFNKEDMMAKAEILLLISPHELKQVKGNSKASVG